LQNLEGYSNLDSTVCMSLQNLAVQHDSEFSIQIILVERRVSSMSKEYVKGIKMPTKTKQKKRNLTN